MLLISVLFVMQVLPIRADSGYFWQINDFHLDPTYETIGDSCTPNLTSVPRNPFGSVECDPPWKLVQSSIQAMKDKGDDPDFIFWLGDNVYHPVDHHTIGKDNVTDIIKNTTNAIKNVFPDVPVYATLGNHDYYPVNDLPGDNNNIYETTANLWSEVNWITDQTELDKFKNGAFYSLPLKNGLNVRVVLFNSNLYNTRNKATENQADPGGQFQWLEETLSKSKTDGEKVYIVMHIPSGYIITGVGSKWFTDAANKRFNEIVRKYSDIILAIFSCHAHMDGFRIYYKNGTPAFPMLIAPAVTPWRGRHLTENGYIFFNAHNPAVRRFKYDRDTGLIQDIEQYMLDLPKANSGEDINWKLQYSFVNDYKIPNVSASSLQTVLNDFKKDDSEFFNKFRKYVFVSTNHHSYTDWVCGCDCKKQILCGIEFQDTNDHEECIEKPATCKARTTFVSEMAIGLILLVASQISYIY